MQQLVLFFRQTIPAVDAPFHDALWFFLLLLLRLSQKIRASPIHVFPVFPVSLMIFSCWGRWCHGVVGKEGSSAYCSLPLPVGTTEEVEDEG